MMQTMKSFSNPKAMADQLLKSNPNAKEINDYINQNGGDIRKAFYAAAKDKGIDPEEIIKQLQ